MNKIVCLSLAFAILIPLSSSAEEGVTTSVTNTQTGMMMKNGGMDAATKALHIGMNKLSDADKATLITMIRDFLTSKGVEMPTAGDVRETRQEIREIKREVRTEVKDLRKKTQEEVKAMREKTQAAAKTKREEMKTKIKEKREEMKTGSGTSI